MVVPTFSAVIMSLNAPNRSFMFKNKKIRKKNFELFCVFNEYFPSIFLKIMLKNNVCVNLISKPLKYRFNVSQLCFQCFPGFLLSLLSKNRSTFFFRKCFGKWPKKSYFEFQLEIAKKLVLISYKCSGEYLVKIWAILQIYLQRR